MTNPASSAVSRTRLNVTLAISVLCLVVWVLLTFVAPVGIDKLHLLLGAGVTLFVRWYGLKHA